ncbi:MAG: sigma 54-interacting transcriptional regulator [Deltaproteobacteria bacterium]|nr:sigma 54-interacting transcriptional regulator [Deltaproteobacteria bacterium]
MSQAAEPCLVVLSAGDERLIGRAFPVGERLRIGRRQESGSELVIDDKLLSGKHATVKLREDGYELVDHRSKNGSFVDGVRVERARLGEGAIVRLGVHVFEFSTTSVDGVATAFDASVPGDETHALVGRSRELRQLVAHLDSLAAGSAPVLFLGEVGVGKEACARRLHARSGRPGEFVSLACSSTRPETAGRLLFGDPGGDDVTLARGVGGTGIVPPDVALLVRANHGTLYLDGIDALDLVSQGRMASYLRERALLLPSGDVAPLDVRVLASSEVDLEPLIADGTFSPPLAKFLSASVIEPAPLRRRRIDVRDALLSAWARLTGGRLLEASATSLEKLLLHDWPENVRELTGLLGRVLATHGHVEALRSAHLPSKIRERVELSTTDQLRASAVDLQVVPSRDELAALLTRFRGDVASLAAFFARDKRQVYRWLKRHDLKLSAFRSAPSP